MKKLLTFLMLLFVFACNEPMQVTAHPDAHSSTSGTLGSAKAENELPNATRDTTNRLDSANHR